MRGKININLGFCPICGLPFNEGYEKHHIIPHVQGGKLTISICISCHNRIHHDKQYRGFATKKLKNTIYTMGITIY